MGTASNAAHFMLIPSPLCGPATWGPVAAMLGRRGVTTTVITLRDGDPMSPYWRQHAATAGAALALLPRGHRPLLVAHGGAGPLLPAIRRAAARPVGGYLFADAGLPHPRASRLDEIARTAPEIAGALRAELTAGGCYPAWDDVALRPLIPDPARRAATLAELRPRPLAFFTETLPQVAAWPDAPCAYLRFSAAYAMHIAAARARGWPTRAFDAGHFHQLVDPEAVAGALLALAAEAAMTSGEERARCGS
jgi:hypothetical protein